MACHNSKNTYGGLNMSDFKSLVKGGNSGAGIQKGNPYESLIYKRVSFPHDHPKFMPPAGVPLSYDQIATLEWWIDNGAKKQLPVSLARKDPKIQRLMEVQYGLDLREKSFLETLNWIPHPKPALRRWKKINSCGVFSTLKKVSWILPTPVIPLKRTISSRFNK
jgi:hypothetical protein